MCGSRFGGLVIGDLRHFDMYTPCARVVHVRAQGRKPPPPPYPTPPFTLSSPLHLHPPPSHTAAMHCTDLHIKKKMERDPLSDDHRDKMCLYSTFSSRRMKLFCRSDGRAARKKRILCENGGKEDGREVREGGVSLKLLLVSTEKCTSRTWRSYPGACYGVKCTCVCACASRARSSWRLCPCATVRWSPRRPIANRIGWVDSRSLSLPIDFFFYPYDSHRATSGTGGGGNTSLPTDRIWEASEQAAAVVFGVT